MADDELSGDGSTSQRNRAPLGTLLAVPAAGTDITSQGNGAAAETPPPAPQPSNQGGETTIFTVPKRQSLAFAAEISRTEGIVGEDSYLFITEDTTSDGVLKQKGWRAFVVSKREPTKQQEIPITDIDLDVDRHEFHAKLRQGHDLVISFDSSGTMSTVLDDKHVRSIDRASHEIHTLVKEKRVVGPGTMLMGDSWIFMRKDMETGRIERWTQSGTSHLGRLEVIQGEPGKTASTSELERPAVSINDSVPLPDKMRELAVYEERWANTWGRNFGSPADGFALESLGNLIDPSDRAKLRQKEIDGAAKANAEEQGKQEHKGLARRGLNP